MGQPLYGSGASPAFTITAQDQTQTICVQGFRTFSLQCVTTGSPTLVVKVFGSNDGTSIGTAELGKWDSGTQANKDVVFLVDKCVQYIILKATTYSGGSSPSAKAYLSGV